MSAKFWLIRIQGQTFDHCVEIWRKAARTRMAYR